MDALSVVGSHRRIGRDLDCLIRARQLTRASVGGE